MSHLRNTGSDTLGRLWDSSKSHNFIFRKDETNFIYNNSQSNNTLKLTMSSTRVYLAYDERMALHKPLPPISDEGCDGGPDVENPFRIHAIYEKLIQLEALDGYRRFVEIPCIPASRETIELTHSPEHYDRMAMTMHLSDDELRQMGTPNDLYFCKDTFTAARIACGGVIECVNAVTDSKRKSNRAIAIVRPPGHHATRDEAMGTFWPSQSSQIQSCLPNSHDTLFSFLSFIRILLFQ